MSDRKRAMFTSMAVSWGSPRALVDSLFAEFGLNFDPCPLNDNVATNGTLPLDFGDDKPPSPDGLDLPWTGRRVFCNPPYGPQIRLWLDKRLDAEMSVFLLPARTCTKWFHDIVIPSASEIRFVRGRLRFTMPNGKTGRAPFPSMVVIFSPKGA